MESPKWTEEDDLASNLGLMSDDQIVEIVSRQINAHAPEVADLAKDVRMVPREIGEFMMIESTKPGSYKDKSSLGPLELVISLCAAYEVLESVEKSKAKLTHNQRVVLELAMIKMSQAADS